MALITLENLEQTADFGRLLAEQLPLCDCPTLLLRGELGSGKTTLVRHLVRNLPNAENAEVCSPSFTIYNKYNTLPNVLHCDLFRCHNNCPEEILEIFDNGRDLIIIEWAEYLAPEDYPKEFLDISFKIIKNTRLLTITASQGKPQKILAMLKNWQ